MSRHQFKLQRLLKCNPLIEIAQSTIWQRESQENKWIFSPSKKWLIRETVLLTFNTTFLCKSWKNRGLQRSQQKRHRTREQYMLCHWIIHKHRPFAQHLKIISISPDRRHFGVYLQLSPRRKIVLTKLQFLNEPGFCLQNGQKSVGAQFLCKPHLPPHLLCEPSQPLHICLPPLTQTLSPQWDVSLLDCGVGSVADKRVDCGSLG